MKHKPSFRSKQGDDASGKPSPVGSTSSRRRFLKQSLAVGVAGVGVQGAQGQSAAHRVKPHKSPPNKKDHTKDLPKDLKQSMEWDFERFLSEVVEHIRNGKTTKQIEQWIKVADSKVGKRQIVKAKVEGDESPTPKDRSLGVCLVAPIEWKMDGEQIVGFTIRGRMGRQPTGEPLECDEFPEMEQTTADEDSGAQAVTVSHRSSGTVPDYLLVALRGGSSSSSSSSSSWRPPS